MGVGKKGNPVFDDVEKSIMDMILSVDDDADSEVDGSNVSPPPAIVILRLNRPW